MVVRKRGTVVDLRGRLGAAALLDELWRDAPADRRRDFAELVRS